MKNYFTFLHNNGDHLCLITLLTLYALACLPFLTAAPFIFSLYLSSFACYSLFLLRELYHLTRLYRENKEQE